MFPLVHYFVNSKIYGKVPPLMALGGVFPDLAVIAGISRDQAHVLGRDLWNWCRRQAPQTMDLARGVISHSADPHGVDYYADEYWPGYGKGWCFLQGQHWIPQVGQVTGLPEELLWWKSHNFIEIGYELITARRYPELLPCLNAGVTDEAAINEASKLLRCYCGIDEAKLSWAFHALPHIFALDDLNARTLAEKQDQSFVMRFGSSKADIPAMAALFEEIAASLEPGYDAFFNYLIGKVSLLLSDK